MVSVSIPSEYDGEPVTEIASITTINSGVFLGCASLQKIYFSDNITYIGDNAFRDCTSLKTVNLPDSLIEIGAQTFYNCTSLSSITIPSNVNKIGSDAFISSGIKEAIFENPNGWTRRYRFSLDGNETIKNSKALSANELQDYANAAAILLDTTQTSLVYDGITISGYYSFVRS